jgi:amidase
MPAAETLDLLYAGAAEQARLVRAGEVSPVELLESHLERIEERNADLNAFVLVKADEARAQAREAEAAVRRGDELGPLHGVPFSCKECILTEGDRTTVGSLLVDLVGEQDAAVVALLREAGGILLGKTNVPDMLACWETDSFVYGRANSAWDPERTPGGSSGGEAAAISAGLSPLGLGSDGGGSVRVPAHFSGIAGLKGTPGRIPYSGHVPPAANVIAHTAGIGPMARRVEDLQLALGVLSAYDPGDPASVPYAAPPPVAAEELEGERVALFTGDGVNAVDPEIVEAVREAGRMLESGGLVVEEVQPPALDRAHEHWYRFWDKVVAVLLGGVAAGREQELHPYVLDFVRADFEGMPLGDYVQAWTERDLARAELLRFMQGYRLLLGPPASVTAVRHGQRSFDFPDGGHVEWLEAFSVAQAWNAFGFPAASVPVATSSEGLPIGAQVVGRPWEDERVLAACRVIEAAAGPYRRPPER